MGLILGRDIQVIPKPKRGHRRGRHIAMAERRGGHRMLLVGIVSRKGRVRLLVDHHILISGRVQIILLFAVPIRPGLIDSVRSLAFAPLPARYHDALGVPGPLTFIMNRLPGPKNVVCEPVPDHYQIIIDFRRELPVHREYLTLQGGPVIHIHVVPRVLMEQIPGMGRGIGIRVSFIMVFAGELLANLRGCGLFVCGPGPGIHHADISGFRIQIPGCDAGGYLGEEQGAFPGL